MENMKIDYIENNANIRKVFTGKSVMTSKEIDKYIKKGYLSPKNKEIALAHVGIWELAIYITAFFEYKGKLYIDIDTEEGIETLGVSYKK